MKEPYDQINRAIDSVRLEREKIVASMADWDVNQASQRHAPDRWSPAEILEHLCKSEHLSLNILWKLVEDSKNGMLKETVTQSNRGRSVEEIAQPYKAAKHKTIQPLEPDLGGPYTFWVESLQANQALIEKVPALLDGVNPHAIIFPHFVIGTLDAYQWLTFTAFHLDRHRHQIDAQRR
jgi:DinB superfamily